MTHRDLCCGCPTLVTFPVGRALLCVSPFLELGPPGASVTTAADFAPQPTGAVVTSVSPKLLTALSAEISVTSVTTAEPESSPSHAQAPVVVTTNTPPDIGDCTGTEAPALELMDSGNNSHEIDSETGSPGMRRPSHEAVGTANFSSSDGPASISPGRIIREGRGTASNAPAVARYPSPTQTFCIGCDAPAFGFFCQACADINATISALEASWLRANSNSPAMASSGISGDAFPPLTAGASASVGASAFSVEIELIDIPDFLPCRSNLMETP